MVATQHKRIKTVELKEQAHKEDQETKEAVEIKPSTDTQEPAEGINLEVTRPWMTHKNQNKALWEKGLSLSLQHIQMKKNQKLKLLLTHKNQWGVLLKNKLQRGTRIQQKGRIKQRSFVPQETTERTPQEYSSKSSRIHRRTRALYNPQAPP
jgi:hypothetical protein